MKSLKGCCAAGLTLPLLMAGIGANDVNPPLAAHNLAVLANLLDARSNFHGLQPGSVYVKRLSIAI